MRIFELRGEEQFIVKILGKEEMMLNDLIKIMCPIVCLCMSGHMSYTINTEKRQISRGASFFYFPSSIISVDEASDDLRVHAILISTKLFHEVSFRFSPSFFLALHSSRPAYISDNEVFLFEAMFRYMERLYADHAHYFRDEIVRNQLQTIFMEAYDKCMRGNEDLAKVNLTHKESMVKDFVQLVHENYNTERGVAYYADKMCLSPRYLSSVVNSITGKTPKEIIDSCVILEIKSLLLSTDMTVQQIAERLRFPNQSFLGRYFKKHTGMIPTKFRDENRAK